VLSGTYWKHRSRKLNKGVMVDNYKIVRYYAPSQNKPNRTIKTGLTLEQAQAHCNDPKTHKEGVYFDGYAKQNQQEIK